MKFISLIIFTILSASIASGEIVLVSMFGSPRCESIGDLLFLYNQTKSNLAKLISNKGPPEEIERHEIALSALLDGLEEPAKQWGMAVVAHFPEGSKVEVPNFEINGNLYPSAWVSQNGLQSKLEFSQLGICLHANSETKQIGDTELVNALNSLLAN